MHKVLPWSFDLPGGSNHRVLFEFARSFRQHTDLDHPRCFRGAGASALCAMGAHTCPLHDILCRGWLKFSKFLFVGVTMLHTTVQLLSADNPVL